MNFISRIFGTEKALSGIVDGVKNGLDALVYTDEEKATDAAKDRSEARKMVVGWMAATQGQNLARRLIALSITGVWLFQYVAAQVMSVANVFVGSDKVAEAIKITMESATDMNGAVMLILAFYFAAPHMSGIAKAVTEKFKSKVNN